MASSKINMCAKIAGDVKEIDSYCALGDDGSLGLVLVEAILYRRLLQIQNTCKRTEANDGKNKLKKKKCYKYIYQAIRSYYLPSTRETCTHKVKCKQNFNNSNINMAMYPTKKNKRLTGLICHTN